MSAIAVASSSAANHHAEFMDWHYYQTYDAVRKRVAPSTTIVSGRPRISARDFDGDQIAWRKKWSVSYQAMSVFFRPAGSMKTAAACTACKVGAADSAIQ